MPRRPRASSTSEPFLVGADGGPGLTRKEARSAALTAPTRGVRVGRDVDLTAAAVRIALLASGPDAVLTDLSGAQTWELPLPAWIALAQPPPPVSVSIRQTSTRPERTGVRGRRVDLPDGHVTEHRGLAVTTPARTWLDCAALMPVEHVVAMGDAILRRQLATIDDLRRMAHWAHGRRGVAVARTALPILDPGAQSPGESWTRCHLVLGRIPPPRCNLDIHDRGEWIARGDLVWEAQKVVVEYDGAVHLAEAQRRHDATRRNLLTRAGWLVLVVTADQLTKPWLLVAMVRDALAARTPYRAGTRGPITRA